MADDDKNKKRDYHGEYNEWRFGPPRDGCVLVIAVVLCGLAAVGARVKGWV